MENGVIHLQNKTSLTNIYQRSPAIWGNCPLGWIKKYYPEGHVRWDASKCSLIGTQTTEIAGPIPGTKVFSTTAGTVNPVSAINSVEKWNGAIKFNTDTDNDSASLAQAYPTFRISGDPASSNKLWFEACWAVNTIVTNTMGVFVGLAETELWTLATGVPFNGGDAITNGASGIGFRKGEDALGVIDTVITDRATSFTNIGDDEGLLTAAYAFAKTGLTYNPGPGDAYDSSQVLKFYQDNLLLSTKYSKTQILATTNLKANALGPIVACVADSAGTTAELYLKWLEVAQLPPGVAPSAGMF